jgi:glycosyltransferase involved in cell wall biosynthesis
VRNEIEPKMDSSETKLVSVIIPCYNQAHFLGEAIESALRQSYKNFQIIVVDDGSVDATQEVASRYKRVECIRQENRGLPGARNAGMRASRGEYIVFLDADDRLMKNALEAGVKSLDSHPRSAFVYGRYKLIAADGSEIPSPERAPVETDHYVALLRRNYIGMPASVMYRRAALDAVGGFDASLKACEDYDLYLRIARNFSVNSHTTIVAEYRQHEANMSRDHKLMMATSLSVLRSQWKFVKNNQRQREAYKEGIKFWRDYCARGLIKQVQSGLRAKESNQVIRNLIALLRYHPREALKRGSRKLTRKIAAKPHALLSRLIHMYNKT